MVLKILAAIITFTFSPLLLSSCTAGEPPAVLRQDITVTLHPDYHEVTGESSVMIRSHGSSRIQFTLAADAKVESCAIGEKTVPFTFSGGILTIDIPATLEEGMVGLTIAYRCRFNDQLPGEAISGEDPTFGVNALVSGKGVFLGPNAGWYPITVAMPAKRTVRVIAPAGTEAITSGRRIAHATAAGVTSSVWEEAHPAGALSLSAGPYQINETRLDGIPIYTYFTSDNTNLAGRYLQSSARYIRFYENIFGPYPFEKFAVVENFFPTGYGFPSYTLLGSVVIRLPFIPDTSLPHEIAHSWWGNGVLIDYQEGNWSEGLVTYLADYLLEERKSPEAGRDYRMRILADYVSLVSPERDFPLREFTGRVDPASRCIGYGKGAMVFHMVRQMIGDKAFFGALHEISSDKLFKRASWDDFMNAFSRFSGKDLTMFRKEWLNRSGGPHLFLAGVTMRRSGKKWVVSGDVAQSSPAYHFPLQLKLETAGGDLLQTVHCEREHTPFSFSIQDEPRRLLLDPDAEIFRILSTGEIPPTVNRIKGAKSLLVVLTPRCRAKQETVSLLLESLGQQGATVIKESEANAARLAGHDLLFCGVPDQPHIAMDSSRISVSRESFTIDRKIFDRPEDALFVVTRHPTDQHLVVALFNPLSSVAAADCVLKVTHYGKYSYLAFTAGENLKKGVAAASSRANEIVFGSGAER
jgi:aminopeptidase N